MAGTSTGSSCRTSASRTASATLRAVSGPTARGLLGTVVSRAGSTVVAGREGVDQGAQRAVLGAYGEPHEGGRSTVEGSVCLHGTAHEVSEQAERPEVRDVLRLAEPGQETDAETHGHTAGARTGQPAAERPSGRLVLQGGPRTERAALVRGAHRAEWDSIP
ncbi:hypothetical protein ABZ957_24300 [Streptomyces sp. NPDC046316]|uniref:hypothetical protein n=1 Tax=Streptomyces sp. NPDC046316 TaxID=3154494 RepID=UPI0033CC9030